MVRPHAKNGLLLKDSKKKEILEWKLMGSRRTGRPRIRWLDDVCNDMKMLNMKNCKEITLNGKAWNYLV
jgi:hypothetical protein